MLDSEFTLEAWVRIRSRSCCGHIVGRSRDPQPGVPQWQYVLIAYDDGTISFLQAPGLAGEGSSVDSPPQPLNTWIHVAGTLHAGVLSLYINGVLQGTTPSNGNPLSSTNIPISIGVGAFDAQGVPRCCAFDGAIAEVRIWSRALGSVDILANAEQILTGSEPGLLANWRLDESSGQLAVDVVSGNDLRLGPSLAEELEDPRAGLKSIVDGGPYFKLSSQTTTPVDLQEERTINELVAIDVDGDLDKDFVLIHHGPVIEPPTLVPIEVFENDGLGVFTVNTAARIDPTLNESSFRSHAADFDGDGRMDLLIPSQGVDVEPFNGEQNRLYLQSIDGKLTDVTSANLPPDPNGFTHGNAIADYDLDGDLDIFESEFSTGARLYWNNGSGFFQMSQSELPPDIASAFFGATGSAAGDVDRDGDADIALFTDSGNQALIINNSIGSFSHAPAGSLPPNAFAPDERGLVVRLEDFDLDGWPDMLLSVTNYSDSHYLQLLRNNRNGTFQLVPDAFPVSLDFVENVWNFEVADLNDDGWLDIAPRGDSRFIILMNQGFGKFSDFSMIAPPVSYLKGYRASFADFDNDIDVDLVTVDVGNLRTFENLKPFDNNSMPAPNLTRMVRTGQEIRFMRHSVAEDDTSLTSISFENGMPSFATTPLANKRRGFWLGSQKVSGIDSLLASTDENHNTWITVVDGNTGLASVSAQVFNDDIIPVEMTAVASYRGQDRFAMMGQRRSSDEVIVRLVDSENLTILNTIPVVSKGFFGVDIATLSAAEHPWRNYAAVLARSDAEESYAFIVNVDSGKRLLTIKQLNAVVGDFGAWPLGIESIGDLNGNGTPEVVVASRSSDGGAVLVVVDAISSAVIGVARSAEIGGTLIDFDVLPGTSSDGKFEVALLFMVGESGSTFVHTLQMSTAAASNGIAEYTSIAGVRQEPMSSNSGGYRKGDSRLWTGNEHLAHSPSRRGKPRSSDVVVWNNMSDIGLLILSQQYFTPGRRPYELVILPDSGGGPGYDIAVLGVDSDSADVDVEIRDAYDGSFLREINLN